MPYGAQDWVKSRIHLATNITAQDVEISRMIEEADDYIDTCLSVFAQAHGLILPLQNPPDQIRRLSNKLAYEYYIHYNAAEHPTSGVNMIKDEVESYVQATYGQRTKTLGSNRFQKTASGITGLEPY